VGRLVSGELVSLAPKSCLYDRSCREGEGFLRVFLFKAAEIFKNNQRFPPHQHAQCGDKAIKLFA